MNAPALFHESITDALREVVQVCGGLKKVGALMRPEKPIDEAARWLSDCLNPDRRERFDPDQVLWLLRAGRQASVHGAANFLMREAGYGDPVPLEPEDERAQLQRDFIKASEAIAQIAQRMDRINIKAVA